MQNLYLAPRGKRRPVPAGDALESAISFLKDQGIIGAPLGPSEYAPGDAAAVLFHADAEQHLLPAELTFEGLSVHSGKRPQFLPRDQSLEDFDGCRCAHCDEPVHGDAFKEAFDRLGIFPVDRVEYECPCCLTTGAFSELDFAQPTAVACFWFKIEGVAFGRLNQALVDHLSKLLELPLTIVPEYIDDQADEWAVVRAMRFR